MHSVTLTLTSHTLLLASNVVYVVRVWNLPPRGGVVSRNHSTLAIPLSGQFWSLATSDVVDEEIGMWVRLLGMGVGTELAG